MTITTDIRELSFVSLKPIPEIPYFWHSVQLTNNIDTQDINKSIGRIANQLKWKNRLAIVADIRNIGLFSPIVLQSTEDYKILDSQRIDLAELRYLNSFFQVCNYQFIEIFRNLKGKVDAYKKRVYSKDINILKNGEVEIEAQRYLTFNFDIDCHNHLIISLDFANEYHSYETLDQMGLNTLQIGDRLLNSYDGKSCEFLEVGTETISTPLNELGRKSLIEYHQQKGNLGSINIDPETPLIKVRYNNHSGKPFDAFHIPQLLKKFFDRSNLDHQEWEEQLLPIAEKVRLSAETMKLVNSRDRFRLSNQSLRFSTDLHKPQKLIYLLSNNDKNLDFGKECFSRPSHGLGKGYLFQKPEEIKASILIPKHQEKVTQNYIVELKQEFKRFGVNLLRDFNFYNPNDSLDINNCCKNLKECDIVIAVIPDSKEEEYHQDNNPYKRIKKQLVPRRIPSQMITYKTINKGWNKFIGYNLILGINAKMGYVSWRLKELRGEAQAFLGLDIGRKNGKAVGASAFLFNGEGQLIGWSNAELQAHREILDRDSLRNIILDLFSFYQTTYQKPLQHLVIHRDGELRNEEYDLLVELSSYLQKNGLINLDVIEVIKYQTCRAVEVQQQKNIIYNKPDKGYIWEHCPNEALILTTGKQEAKVSPNSSPRPLRIRKRMGGTNLMLLAEQVYWLSEMQVGSIQTVRLPITTYYADKAAEYALESLLPLGLQNDPRLWFL